MEKKIYSRKYDFNASCIILTSIFAFLWVFFLIVGIFGGMDLPSIILITITSIVLFYFLIHVLVGIKLNKQEIYENHMEINLFKTFVLRKYNIKKDEIDRFEYLGFLVSVILKNGKKIKLTSICETNGKSKYNEMKKFQNALKKIGF